MLVFPNFFLEEVKTPETCRRENAQPYDEALSPLICSVLDLISDPQAFFMAGWGVEGGAKSAIFHLFQLMAHIS